MCIKKTRLISLAGFAEFADPSDQQTESYQNLYDARKNSERPIASV